MLAFSLNHARLAHATVLDIVLIAAVGRVAWQLIFQDKITAPWRNRILDRYPPDGWEYDGRDAVKRIPHTRTGPRLVRYEPTGGTIIQETDAEGRLLWQTERDPDDQPAYVEDPVSGALILATTTTPPALPEPVLAWTGRWVVAIGHGSAFGRWITCPRCPSLWCLIAAAGVYEASPNTIRTFGVIAVARVLNDLTQDIQSRLGR